MKSWTAAIKNAMGNKRGETLVESVLSMLLLAILFTSVAAMITTALNMTKTSLASAAIQQQAVNAALAGDYTTEQEVTITFKAQGMTLTAETPGHLTDAEGYIAFQGGTP